MSHPWDEASGEHVIRLLYVFILMPVSDSLRIDSGLFVGWARVRNLWCFDKLNATQPICLLLS